MAPMDMRAAVTATANGRLAFAVTVSFLLIVARGCLSLPSAGGHQECTGALDCRTATAAACGQIPGCIASPGCNIFARDPDPYGEAIDCSFVVNCPAPKCSLASGACAPHCDDLTDEATCNALHAEERTSAGSYVWECGWSNCHGHATKGCGDYSVAECPRNLGCEVGNFF